MHHHHPLSARHRAAPFRAVGVALLLAVGCARPEPGPSSAAKPSPPAPAPVSPSPAAALPAPSPRVETHTRGWSVDKRYSYRIKLTTTLGIGDGPKSFDFDLVGNAVVIPARVTSDETTVYVSIPDASIVSRIPSGQPGLDQAAADIRGTGMFFTLSRGKLGELHLPKSQSVFASTSYRAVAAALQFAHATHGETRYTTEEFDTTGRAAVEYVADGSGSSWKKEKLRYLAVLGAAQASGANSVPLLPEVASEAKVNLSAGGRPLSVELHERLLIKGAQAPMRSEVILSLASGPEAPAPSPAPDWTAKLASTRAVAPDQPLGVAAPVEQLDAARIGSLDFDQIVSGLEQSAIEKSTRKAVHERARQAGDDSVSEEEEAALNAELRQDSQLFLALGALFRRDKTAIVRAVAKIHAKSPAAPALMDALSSAGSEPAQEALAKLTEAPDLGAELQSRAAVALSRTPTPSPASVRSLKALLRGDPFDIRGLYGLGTFARRLRDEGKTAESDALGEFLVAKLGQAKNPTDKVTALRSIANSGYAKALARILPYLSDDSEKMRSAAVRALQSMRDPRVDGLLAARLHDDGSNVVRLSALDAVQLREPSPVLTDAVVAAGTQATDTHLRFRAVEVMIRWLPQQPTLRATLEVVAKNDAEPKIRNRAQAAL